MEDRGGIMRDMGKQMGKMARIHGESMRKKAMALAKRRKEEYLGARVPAHLKERVIARANALGIPVSTLIRNVLEEAFVDESTGPAPAQLAVASAAPKETPFPHVIGWEQIRLNQSLPCSGCGRELTAGEAVTLGLAMAGADHVVLCSRCKPLP